MTGILDRALLHRSRGSGPKRAAHSQKPDGRGGGRSTGESTDRCSSGFGQRCCSYSGDGRTAFLDLANAIRPLAILREDAGAVEEAKRLWTEARDLYAAVDVAPGVAECSSRLARLG